MEYVSDINIEKQLIGIMDNNSLKLWDIKKKHYIHSFNIQNLSKFLFSQNFDHIIASDLNGKIYTLDIVNFKVLLSSKIHDKEITSFCISYKQTFVYSVSLDDSIKVTNYLSGELISVFNLNSEINKKLMTSYLISIDRLDKNLVFSVNETIKLKNLTKNLEIKRIGSHVSNITDLNFCNDNKLFISLSNDNYINVWHLKNIGIPLLTLKSNSVCRRANLNFFTKGVYHAFCYNNSAIYSFKLNFSEISKDDTMKNVLPLCEISVKDSNLINLRLINNDSNKVQSLFLLFGTTDNLHSKTIKYAKNFLEFKETNIVINSLKNKLERDSEIDGGGATIPNDIDMKINGKAYNELTESKFKNLYNLINNNKEKSKNADITSHISLIKIIKTSLIDNDQSNFNSALNQSDLKTIENTVSSMDKETINMLITKLIDMLQSTKMTRTIFIWLDSLIKNHFFTILSLPKSTLEKLNSIQELTKSKTNVSIKIMEVMSKLDSILNLFSDKEVNSINNENMQIGEDTQMLLKNESDSDHEKNKKFNIKVKKNKIKVSAVEKTLSSKKGKKLNKKEEMDKKIDEEIQKIEDEDVDIEMGNEDIEGDSEFNEIIDE